MPFEMKDFLDASEQEQLAICMALKVTVSSMIAIGASKVSISENACTPIL